MTDDEQHEKLCAFQEDFARLVRKYMPKYPLHSRQQAEVFGQVWPPGRKSQTIVDPQKALLLMQMQDSTSCYNPYVWSEEFDTK